jgi:hypothetical protein
MTTTLSFEIRTIKNQIAACLREIARGVKSFVDSLVILEGKLEKLEKSMINQVDGVLAKFAANVVRGSSLSAKNGYRKQKEARSDMNEILRQNGFRWVKSERLDIAQGETGEFYWSLEDSHGKEWQPLKALCHIYSQPTAWLIPRSGGKLRQLEPADSFNVIKAALEYGVI